MYQFFNCVSRRYNHGSVYDLICCSLLAYAIKTPHGILSKVPQSLAKLYKEICEASQCNSGVINARNKRNSALRTGERNALLYLVLGASQQDVL